MRWYLINLLIFISCGVTTSWAQSNDSFRFSGSRSEDSQSDIIEVDTTLFRLPVNFSSDPYTQATRYYRVQGASRRRGLYYTTAEQIIEPSKEYLQPYEEPLPQTKFAIYGAQSNYRVGLSASHSQRVGSKWSLSSSIWAQTGRNQFVEGVFRNSIAPQILLSRRFSDNHYIKIEAALYYSMRGLQYGATSEAFSLIGSNYYNPSWGLYNGKVRNSRVRRDFSPTISAHYQRPLQRKTTLIIEAAATYSREANSALGWYNASTPMPDYYRKMPSFMPQGEVQDYVTNIWRTNQREYTQINWNEMVHLNSISADGNAFYVQEDRVEKELSTKVDALLHTRLSDRFTITYGSEASINNCRNFKLMRDLLGASHLVDYDLFFGDDYNKTLPLENNLRNPDNHIYEGDRFGYDFSQIHSSFNAIARASYRANRLDFNLEATIGAENFHRVGHFEKERFPSSASSGKSTEINLSPYTLRMSVGYASHADKYVALKLISSRLSPLSRNLFINESSANLLSPSLRGERINSAAIAFHINRPLLLLSGEVYILSSRDGSSVYSLYDDLTHTMCRASITEIGYCSYGVELIAELRLHSDLKLSATLAAGRYFYDTDPNIELVDDYDLTTISSPTPSRMRGITIGNAPQIATTASLAYFGLNHYIFNISSSYAALRYEQPSITRRSERLIKQAFTNTESAEAALNQQRLGDIFDVEISATRLFWFNNGHRLLARLSIKNLLGDNDREVYAKESDRILLQSVDNYSVGATMRESISQYGAPRTLQLSVSYQF